jgi:hypothetical protein
MAEKSDPIFSHAHFYTLGEVEEIAGRAGLNPKGALGTLTANPESPEAGDEIVTPSRQTGVIAIEFAKSSA